MATKLVYICLLTAYCLMVYWLSDQPKLDIPDLFPHQDKVFHAITYGIMGILAWKYFASSLQQAWLLGMTSWFFCAFYGATDEWHQSFVPGRHADVLDWLADILGAGLAIGSMTGLKRLEGRPKNDRQIE